MFSVVNSKRFFLLFLLFILGTCIAHCQNITPQSFIRGKRIEAIDSIRLRGIWYKSFPKAGVDSIRIRSSETTDTIISYGNSGDATVIGFVNRTSSLTNGGIVTLNNGLTYDVTGADYFINKRKLTSLSGSITLDPPPTSNSRYDVIALDTGRNIIKLTGVPAINPVLPQVNPRTQLFLAYIKINTAGAIGTTRVKVYDENTEWTTSSTAFPATNFNDLSKPYQGVKAALTENQPAGYTLNFINPGAPLNIIATTGILKFRIVENDLSIYDDDLRILLTTSTGVTQTLRLLDHGYGYQYGGSYINNKFENISIQITQFGFAFNDTTKITGVKIISATHNAQKVVIDAMEFQGGIYQGTQPTDYVTDVYKKAGTDSLFYVKNGVNVFIANLGSGGGGGFNNTIFNDTIKTITTNTDQTWALWQPYNYGTIYSDAKPGTQRMDRWYNGYATYFGVNNSSRPNQIWYHGYNCLPSGGRTDTRDAAFQFRHETHFDIFGLNSYFEFHLPEITRADGTLIRLHSIYADKTTGDGFMESHVNSNSWYNTLGATPYATLQSGNGNLNGSGVFRLNNYTVNETGRFELYENGKHITTLGSNVYGASIAMQKTNGNTNPTVFSFNGIDDLRIDAPAKAKSFLTTDLLSDVINASAQLEVRSTNKGFLPPRMTTLQKNSILTPAQGLLVFDNILNKLQIFNGTTWADVAAGGGGGAAGGVSTNVQFNSGATFAGVPEFSYNNSTKTLVLKSTTNAQANFYGYSRGSGAGDRWGEILLGSDPSFQASLRYDNNSLVLENTFPDDVRGSIFKANNKEIMYVLGNVIKTSKPLLLGSLTGNARGMLDVQGTGWNYIAGNADGNALPNTAGVSGGLMTAWNASGGGGETSLLYDSQNGGNPKLRFGEYNGTTAIYNFHLRGSGINIGADIVNTSSALSINSTTQGVLIPRMTTIERNAIVTPAAQLQVANTDSKTIDIYTGNIWQSLQTNSLINKSSNYTATVEDNTINCTGSFTITLPSSAVGKIFIVKNSGTGVITITAPGNIDGGNYTLISQYKYVTVQATGSGYIVISNN